MSGTNIERSAGERTVGVVGGGSWGTAMAALLAENGNRVTVWALENEVVDGINEANQNPIFHPGVPLPPGLMASGDQAATVLGSDLVVMAVPTQFTRSVVEGLRDTIDPAVPVVSLSKGIEAGTLLRPTEVIAEVLGGHETVGVLSGPNLAREIVLGQSAAAVLAFDDVELAQRLQPIFDGPRFDVYVNDDVIGCELGGSIKNVIAVMAGMAAGLGHGQNVIAALISRGLVEMATLGVALGARPETFLGLAGQGDLVATCLSEQSRNHRFGRELAKGRSVADIAAETDTVAEGVKSVDNLLEIAAAAGVDTPLMKTVQVVVEGETDVADAFERWRPSGVVHELQGLAATADPSTLKTSSKTRNPHGGNQ